MSQPWIATYRLQLHEGFSLAAAESVLPYLKKLGISHVYLSPCLQATPGSQHGYDVIDPTVISADIGGESMWARFVASAHAQSLGILLDIVPNHMAATALNPWWDDVLRHGPFSDYAQCFDIRLRQDTPFKVHVCSLGKPYGKALTDGELTLDVQDGVLRIKHFDNSWPVTPASWGSILSVSDPSFKELATLAKRQFPNDEERQAYVSALQRAQVLYADALEKGSVVGDAQAINADDDRLDEVIQQQFYTLHGWKLGGELINYRRFFDVSTLVGLATERPEVFDAAHARFKAMVESGDVDGLRVDHPDGLREPLEYLKRLRELLPKGRIYVEKILDNEEKLPSDWPIDGTVGYDFLAKVNRLWMSDQHIDALTATYADFTNHSVNLGALIREKKDYIVGHSFSHDLRWLADAASRIALKSRDSRDISPRQIVDAIAQVTAAMSIYRTYRSSSAVSENDKLLLTEAIRVARFARSDVDEATYDFLLALLTKSPLTAEEDLFVSQWQQLTPAVMAKGVEDTTFYCFDRLLSCNEVGAQASLIGISSDKFHEYCHYLSEQWPRNQLATSTHDNKRSEDVRTRISLLSEMPGRWAEALQRWSTLNADAWNNRTPDRHAEYLLYQTLIGAWPIDAERCWAYMLKASREAKMRTSWQEPNASYEGNIKGFVERALANEEFIASLIEFVTPLIEPGRINSLAQTLIKLTAPGIPDFYQGTELWDLSLVDPDNRRPVDYKERAQLLECSHALEASQVLSRWDSGLPKLWMIDRVLSLRAKYPDEFAEASRYQPLVAQGAHLGNIFSFRRGENLIVSVPRLQESIKRQWDTTVLPLPKGEWHHVFTGEEFRGETSATALYQHFPVALFIRNIME